MGPLSINTINRSFASITQTLKTPDFVVSDDDDDQVDPFEGHPIAKQLSWLRDTLSQIFAAIDSLMHGDKSETVVELKDGTKINIAALNDSSEQPAGVQMSFAGEAESVELLGSDIAFLKDIMHRLSFFGSSTR